jgi:hypothetical protein
MADSKIVGKDKRDFACQELLPGTEVGSRLAIGLRITR